MLISATIFYGQTRARMKRLIDSLEGRVDAAVFLDGPYRGLASAPSKDATIYPYIAEQCERVGIQYAIFGGEVYNSEPAKRTAALQAARLYTWEPLPQRQNEALGQEKWGLIIDSDEWLESDINWALIEQKGTGTISLSNWDGERPSPEREGEGATMVRIIPLLGGLVYGPAHYDLMDSRTGIVFSGHDKGLTAPNAPCAVLGHDVGPKTIAAEYEAYNDGARAEAEGKLLRIAEVADDHTFVVIVMDAEQQKMNHAIGTIARFPKHMLPEGVVPEDVETLPGLLEKVSEPDDFGVVRMWYTFISEERVDEIVSDRQALAQQMAERDQMLLEHRRRKQARKAARRQRIMDSQQRRGF